MGFGELINECGETVDWLLIYTAQRLNKMLIRKWTAQAGEMSVTFECPYYDHLLPANDFDHGRLTRDLECHALWHYACLAMTQYERAKRNIVEESELSLIFDVQAARNLFLSVANNHGVSPGKMVRFWDVINRQRLALGGGQDLPDEFKFRFWGN
jgi:hypothetical protein